MNYTLDCAQKRNSYIEVLHIIHTEDEYVCYLCVDFSYKNCNQE